MPEYYSAAVCLRGHIETKYLERASSVAAHCTKCGAVILTGCPKCGTRIRGGIAGVVSGGWRPADFCESCGGAQPWASRQARLYQLENILDENDDLSDADALTVREQLEALRRHPDEDEAEQVKRWQRIKKVAPSLTGAGRDIFVSVASAVIQKQLGV